MFSKRTSSTIAILVGAILVVGTGIGLPSMNTVQALSKITISQANSATDACSGIINCQNLHNNLGVVNGAPNTDQNINIKGSQNIDQSNTCSDDDLGVPGAILCNNDAGAAFGNVFVLDNLNGAADVQVNNFEQGTTQENNCQLFDVCDNLGGNSLTIAAEDNDGPAATNTDVFIGSSVQTTSQGNDCQGSAPPDPFCSNFDTNSIEIVALADGDVNLADSTQTANLNDNCDDGQVVCTNFGDNTLLMVADGENAELDLGINVQSIDSQDNDCVNAGTVCSNNGGTFTDLEVLGDGIIDISSSTQTLDEGNSCNTTAQCSNTGSINVGVLSLGAATSSGSNTQSEAQSNTCSLGSICSNFGNSAHLALAFDDSTVSSDASQLDAETNTCTGAICDNTGQNFNEIQASADASITSTSSQSSDLVNTCSDSICTNSNGNTNQQTGGAGSEFESDNTQSSSNTNQCTSSTATCTNAGTNTVLIG